MRVPARAKLTLSLRVTGVRADGYHELDAEMVTVSLADELTFGPGRNVLPPEDLVSRALTAVGRQAHVVVDKRIPAGAGLGGGSADAAAVLRWAGCDDLGVAAAIGADVPFCLVGGRALDQVGRLRSRRGNEYISPDVDRHNGGIWKKATGDAANLRNKTTRDGTFNEDLTEMVGP